MSKMQIPNGRPWSPLVYQAKLLACWVWEDLVAQQQRYLVNMRDYVPGK